MEHPQDRLNHPRMPVKYRGQQDGVVGKIDELMGHPIRRFQQDDLATVVTHQHLEVIEQRMAAGSRNEVERA